MSTNVTLSINDVLIRLSKARTYEKIRLNDTIKPELGALLKELLEVVPREFDHNIFGDNYSIREKKIIEHLPVVEEQEVSPYAFVQNRINSIEGAQILLNQIQEIERYLGIGLAGKYLSSKLCPTK